MSAGLRSYCVDGARVWLLDSPVYCLCIGGIDEARHPDIDD